MLNEIRLSGFTGFTGRAVGVWFWDLAVLSERALNNKSMNQNPNPDQP